MRKLKLGLFTMVMCMLLGSTTASAASFRFVVVPEGCDDEWEVTSASFVATGDWIP